MSGKQMNRSQKMSEQEKKRLLLLKTGSNEEVVVVPEAKPNAPPTMDDDEHWEVMEKKRRERHSKAYSKTVLQEANRNFQKLKISERQKDMYVNCPRPKRENRDPAPKSEELPSSTGPARSEAKKDFSRET